MVYLQNLENEEFTDSQGGVWIIRCNISTKVAAEINAKYGNRDDNGDLIITDEASATIAYLQAFLVSAPAELEKEYKDKTGKIFSPDDLGTLDPEPFAEISEHISSKTIITEEESDF